MNFKGTGITRDSKNGPRLLLLPALKAHEDANGRLVVTRKFLDGVLEYVRRWPGPVEVRMQVDASADNNLDHVVVDNDSLPFELGRRPVYDEELRRVVERASCTLVTLVRPNAHVPRMCRETGTACVLISEYTLRTRKQIIHAETRNPILRLRRSMWAKASESMYRKAVMVSDGIQCNGTPTYEAYKDINRSPMLYFDTRVRAAMLPEQELMDARAERLNAGEPLRLLFSGRLIAMKGVDHLIDVARALRDSHIEFTMDICGGGELDSLLSSSIMHFDLGHCVNMKGVLDFDNALLPYVQQRADLFVCCHRQGDPSCTYLETLACGVPIVGYDNEALNGIVRESNAGWATPLDNPAALAERIVSLNGDRVSLIDASRRALAFARHHTFEIAMNHRVDHLQHCQNQRRAAA